MMILLKFHETFQGSGVYTLKSYRQIISDADNWDVIKFKLRYLGVLA